MSLCQSKKQINFYLADSDDEQTSVIDRLITNIKNYSQQNGNLLEKYDEHFYLNYFDRNTIQQTFIKLGNQEEHKKELKLQEFIRKFLTFIDHTNEETLFLAMSLRTLFIKIKQQTNNEIGLKFSDFTNYLCDRIAKDDPDLVAPLKQVPQQKIHPDVSRIRQIDINPPLVLKNDTQSDQPRIAKTKKKKDKKLAERKPVSKFIYNFQSNQIITIGRLSSCIHFYDDELKKTATQITPKTYLDISRQIAILSMDFDEVNQRIGVIINGMGILFWEASDNYETQKCITKYYGEKIFYLKLFKEWITSDKNTIYFWNLNDESVSKKIVNEEAVMVNDVCEINHLRCICVSYTNADGKKPFVVYKNNKPIARYDMGSTGCHSLHYNIPSQMIIAAGYHNAMEVFQVENKTFSINLKKQLKGHSSIVTCISDIRNTNFILSGDDSGEIRIWQLNFMRCIQVVKVSKYINEVYCTGEKLIFSDSRLNVMEMDKFSLPYTNDDEIIYQFFDEETCSQYAVARKCFRKINFYTGRIEMVFVLCDEDQQISSAIKISAGIIIGTSKGNMKLYTIEGREKWSLPAHEGEITAIKYDRKTRFIFCLGSDNKLTIWPEKSLLTDGPKKVVTFKNKVFNIMTLLPEVRVIFLASSEQNQICVWDYENLKLLTIIKTNAPAVFIDVNTLYRMLMVSTINDELIFFKLYWKNGYLDYEMVYNGDSSFTGVKKVVKQVGHVIVAKKESLDNEESSHEQKTNEMKNKNGSKKLISKASILPENQGESFEHVTEPVSKISCKQDKTIKKSALKMTASYSIQRFDGTEPQPTPLPSIKLIKEQQQNQGGNQLNQDSEQVLRTLKSLKKIDSEITSRIEIKNTQESVFLVMGNSKGQITCFDISSLIKDHFSDYETQFKQVESPNIYRTAKQDYDQEIFKQKHTSISIETMKRIPKVKKNFFRNVWKQACRNREPISCLSFIEMKHVYLAISTTDGCCKYFDLPTGKVKGDLKMNLPLPIFWDVEIEKDLYIKKNIYETLIVLDSVISNHGFEMLSKEYQAINVTKFLEFLQRSKPMKKQPVSKANISKPQAVTTKPKVTLLKQEYSIEDVKSLINGVAETTHHECTLKSLEVNKRVNLIKQQMNLETINSDERPNSKGSNGKPSNQLLRQKEELQKLLAYNYFSVLGEQGPSNRLNKSLDLGSLEERSSILIEKVNKNKKTMIDEPVPKKPTSKRLKRQASLVPTLPALQTPLAESHLFAKEDTCKQDNLVEKLSHSLNLKGGAKPKTNSEFTSLAQSFAFIGAIMKKNQSCLSMMSSKLSKLSRTQECSMEREKENKYDRRQLDLERSHIVEDKSAREILSEINEKLSRYKKSNYAKRDLI